MTRLRLSLLLAAALAPLCGFTSCERRPEIPEIAECPATPVAVDVTRVQYVRLPDRITRPVLDPAPAEPATVGDAWAAANRRGALLDTCNGQLREAAALEGTEATR